MDTDRLNRWLALDANIGVLIGIILLIIELDQNRDMQRSQTRSDIAMGVVGLTIGIAGNSDLADILARAAAGETLTPSERVQFLNRQIAMHRYWEIVHYQYRNGLYDEAEFSSQKEAWRLIMNDNPATVSAWCERRPTFSPEYRAEIDSLLEIASCD